jgi:hypothetical protein
VIFTQKCVAFPPNDYAFEASHQNLECIAKVIANTMYEKHVANCTTLTVPANVLTSKTIFNSLFAKSWTQSYDLALQPQHCKNLQYNYAYAFTFKLCSSIPQCLRCRCKFSSSRSGSLVVAQWHCGPLIRKPIYQHKTVLNNCLLQRLSQRLHSIDWQGLLNGQTQVLMNLIHLMIIIVKV